MIRLWKYHKKMWALVKTGCLLRRSPEVVRLLFGIQEFQNESLSYKSFFVFREIFLLKLNWPNLKFIIWDKNRLVIVGPPPPLPLPPLLKMGGMGGGRTFKKLSHLGYTPFLPKILLERGDNHEKGGLM